MSEEKTEYKAEGAAAGPDGIGTESRDIPSGASADLSARITALEAQIADKDSALAEAKKVLETQSTDFTALKTSHDAAVTAYRKLAVSSNPLFSAELITGNTIAEVDASMQKINDLAGLVRSKLEAEIKSISVPAGAPERSGPDTSGLSPREKIRQGLEKK